MKLSQRCDVQVFVLEIQQYNFTTKVCTGENCLHDGGLWLTGYVCSYIYLCVDGWGENCSNFCYCNPP